MNDRLERFGHHPDPAIDFCVELECLEGMLYDESVGLPVDDLERRIRNAEAFVTGGDAGAVRAKQGFIATLQARQENPDE